MNKVFLGLLVTGAAVAAGYVVVKALKGKDVQPDYDDDIYDYPDPYGTDESIDFEINDTSVKEFTDDAAEKAEDVADAVAEGAEDVVDAVKDAAEDVADAVDENIDNIKDTFSK